MPYAQRRRPLYTVAARKLPDTLMAAGNLALRYNTNLSYFRGKNSRKRDSLLFLVLKGFIFLDALPQPPSSNETGAV